MNRLKDGLILEWRFSQDMKTLYSCCLDSNFANYKYLFACNRNGVYNLYFYGSTTYLLENATLDSVVDFVVDLLKNISSNAEIDDKMLREQVIVNSTYTRKSRLLPALFFVSYSNDIYICRLMKSIIY